MQPDPFIDAILPLIPVFAIIALGYGLKVASIIEDGVWPALERLTWYVFLPALLLVSIANANLADLPVGDAFVVVWMSVVIVIATLIFMRKGFGFADPSFAAVFQASIRPNVYVAFAAAFALHGEDSLPAAALALIVYIPLVNIFAVLGHARWGDKGDRNLLKVLVDVLTNPVIVACIVGILLNRTGTEIPAGVDQVLELLGRAALPLGLITVGAALEFRRLRMDAGAIATASVFKLVMLPALVLVGMNLTGMEGVPAEVILLFAAAPISVSCYVTARQLGGDAKLTAGIITLHSLLAAVTLPVWLFVKNWFI